MGNSSKKNSAREITRKILIRGVGTFTCLFLLLLLALKIYLATPFAAPQLSRLLTSYLHQSVMVSALRTTGGTLYIKGLSLANPRGFPAGNLATADSITIAPQWGKLLRGSRDFRLIKLEGVQINIRKDSTGTWNYSGLQQAFAGKKPTTSEIFIKQFVIKEGSFRINGQGTEGISLQIFNLATRGSDNARIELAFEDAARNHYAISGKARPGKEPGFDLALSAPSLALSAFAKALPLKYAAILEEGRANLQMNAALQEGQLRVNGTVGFNRISLPIAKKILPMTGLLRFKADYNIHNDQARIETLNLNINNLFKLYLTGAARNLRGKRSFSASIDMNEINLATLAYALPDQERRRLVLGGTLGSTRITISGDAHQGVTDAAGSIMLQNGSLTWDGRSLVSGLDSNVRLFRQGDGFTVNGHLSLHERHGKALLDAINAPFAVSLSKYLKLRSAEIPSLSARVMGIPVMGRLGFKASEANPFTATLRIPATKVSALQPLLDRFDLHLDSGTSSLAVEAVGQGPQAFRATATVQLAAIQGHRGKSAFAMKHGTADSRMSWSRQRLIVAGNVQISGMATDGKTGEAGFAYSLADGLATLDHASFRLNNSSATIARLAARIPVQASRQDTSIFPLFLEMSGAEIHQNGSVLSGLSGTVRGNYATGSGGRWQERLACVFEVKGDAITLKGTNSKTLLAGAGLRVTGEFSRDKVAIREAILTAGKGLALTATGELTNAFSTQREGSISFMLPQTSLNSIIDPFVNNLPRLLQEATLDGSMAAKGTIELHDNKKLLNGAFAIKGGRLEVPSQKLIAADINGTLPFSLDLSGQTSPPAKGASTFTRANFPHLLQQLRQQPVSGQSFSVGKISFGPLDLGTLTMHIKAGNGITEIASLTSSFNEGKLVGKGFVAVKGGLNYRGDLLIHDLSLRQLCNSFPAIKGYISGRLDGIISLYGEKNGLQGLAGFTELWAREGSGEKMLVSKEFLQRISGKKLQGFFFRNDRPYDQAEINATLEEGYLAFETLDIAHTNFLGMRDLSVSIAPSQNRIALEHLFDTIKQATATGKAVTGDKALTAPSIAPEFKWEE